MTFSLRKHWFCLLAFAFLLDRIATLHAFDCNGNGVEDAADLLPSDFGLNLAPFYPAGALPYDMIAVDLDGDTTLDIVTANHSSNDISLLFNQGRGSFGGAIQYAVGEGPSFLIADDFNGDGNPDIATSNAGSRTVSILLNLGKGKLSEAVNYPVGFGSQWPLSINVADLSGDGRPDITTVNFIRDTQGPGSVSVLVNQG